MVQVQTSSRYKVIQEAEERQLKGSVETERTRGGGGGVVVEGWIDRDRSW